jgi:hypothetical protein
MPMPFSDLFQPDVNFVSARGAYPTMPGGTAANAAGAMTTSTNAQIPDDQTGSAAATVSAAPVSVSGNSVWWWLGFLGLLLGMVFIARKAGGEEDFRNLRPTLYNFFAVTLTSIVGIVGMKVIATKFRVPGASDIILAA